MIISPHSGVGGVAPRPMKLRPGGEQHHLAEVHGRVDQHRGDGQRQDVDPEQPPPARARRPPRPRRAPAPSPTGSARAAAGRRSATTRGPSRCPLWNRPGPSEAVITMASRMAGKASVTSTIRISTASTQPPKNPATAPNTAADHDPAGDDREAQRQRRRAPRTGSGYSTSRPSASVPSRCSALGGEQRQAGGGQRVVRRPQRRSSARSPASRRTRSGRGSPARSATRRGRARRRSGRATCLAERQVEGGHDSLICGSAKA